MRVGEVQKAYTSGRCCSLDRLLFQRYTRRQVPKESEGISAMHIRRADLCDFDAVMALYHEAADAMAGTPHDCRWRRGGHPTRDFVHTLIVDGNVLVADEDARVVGAVATDHDLGYDYAGASWLVDVPDELVCVVHLLAVCRDQRGKGLSRSILRTCLAQARERGMRTARLDVTANNVPAIGLYRSEGFVVVGADDLDVNPDGDALVPFLVMERLL